VSASTVLFHYSKLLSVQTRDNISVYNVVKYKVILELDQISLCNTGGVQTILTDQNKLVVAVGGVTALAAGIYTTR
jgi:hypothetical protein